MNFESSLEATVAIRVAILNVQDGYIHILESDFDETTMTEKGN